MVDILLDFIVKREHYQETIFCIDEPELHLNTQIQRALLVELEKMIPDNCQLWVATHSSGFLRALQEDLRDQSTVIDFSNQDFDKPVVLKPIAFNRSNWQRIFRTALEDMTGLLAPKKIIYCEGNLNLSLDEKMFNDIFRGKADALFVSAGNKSDSIKYAGVALTILNKAFSDVAITVVVDRDAATSVQVPKLSGVEVRALARREFENYLCDYEIVNKAYPSYPKSSYSNIIPDIINDDVKSLLPKLAQEVGAKDAHFLKESLGQAVTEETAVYQELENIIFS